MPSAWTTMILVQSSTARGDIPMIPWSSAMYVQSNMPYILSATGIQTQDLPDHDQNVTNDALDCLAMKAGYFWSHFCGKSPIYWSLLKLVDLKMKQNKFSR